MKEDPLPCAPLLARRACVDFSALYLCGGKKARSSVDIIRRYHDQEPRRRANRSKVIIPA